MPRITAGTVIKLVVASIVVGAIMAFFNVTPQSIYLRLFDRLGDMAENIGQYLGSALTYFLLGAVVVVPIWLVAYLWRAVDRKPR